MKPIFTALAVVLAAGAATSSPASAQSNAAASQAEQSSPKIKLSKAASKAIIELQNAVKANDVANIPAKIAAAQAVASTADDRYAIGALRLEAARAAKDNLAIAAAIDAVLASGKAEPNQMKGLYGEQANAYVAAKQPERAVAALQHLIAVDPGNAEAKLVLANVLKSQGKGGQAVAELQKSIAAAKAAGRKPDENMYKLALSGAYEAKSPSAIEIAREWVADYPTPQNWENTFAVYQNLSQLDDSSRLELLRLERAVGALNTESDYHKYAYLAVSKGYPLEAQAVLDEGFASGKINRTTPLMKEILAEVSRKAAGDKASLAKAVAAGTSAPTARAALINGDLLSGAGQYAQAAEVYRAALGKSGADADLINLHLGAALARAGDKAAATAALNAVKGSNAGLAKLWLTYLATRG